MSAGSGNLAIIEFRQRLANEAQEYYRRRDIAGIISVLDRLERKSTQESCLDSKLVIDTTIAHVLTLAAEAHLDDLDFSSCFELCRNVWQVLNQAALLGRQLNGSPPPQGNALCGLLTILADAKWKVPQASLVNEVIPAVEMIAKYTSLNTRVCAYISRSNDDEEKIQNNMHALLWCGVMHLKLAMRFFPNLVDAIEYQMNKLFPGITQNAEWSYYWDIEIAKQALSTNISRRSLVYYYYNRHQCVKKRETDIYKLAAFKMSAAKEMEHLLSCRLIPA